METNGMQIVNTILHQISIGTKMACGARDFVGGEACGVDGACKGMPFLWFRVRGDRKLRKVIIGYDYNADAYNLMHVEMDKKACGFKVLESAEEIYVDNLNETIYRMVNK